MKVHSREELLVNVWNRRYLPTVPLWNMAPSEYHRVCQLSFFLLQQSTCYGETYLKYESQVR